MQLIFDLRKAVAALAFLLEKEGGQLDMFLGLKMLYLADKNVLIKWGKTITGDKFISMPKGPVLSCIYNLFKGTAARKNQREWDAYFSERVNHSIHLLKKADTGVLSEREMDVLDKARKEVKGYTPWEVADWLHKSCPEWQDPNGSSIPIDPRLILRNAGRSPQEIKLIEESNRTFAQAQELLERVS